MHDSYDRGRTFEGRRLRSECRPRGPGSGEPVRPRSALSAGTVNPTTLERWVDNMTAAAFRRAAASVAVLALTLAACGGDNDTEEATDATTEAQETEAEETEAQETEASEEAAGCSPDDLETFEPGTLTVATGDPVFPPWMLDDDPAGGEGFENGLVYALAEELGYAEGDVAWVRTGFDEAIAPGPKEYDFNIQQFSVTEEREEVVDFSIVYYQPEKAVIALPGSATADATSFDDLREASWGASIGTTDLDYLENILGVTDVAVFDDQAGVFQALEGGQIDATVAALPTALFATAVQVPDAAIVAVLPADPNDNGHGLLFEDGSPLVDCIDQGLQALIDAGVVDELASEYLTGDGEIPAITE
jgi:polar amino acid transport system substrate-binding protein